MHACSSNFSAAFMNAVLPPPNTHDVLGTLTPLSSHCKAAISYLVSIHSPYAFQGALPSLPIQALTSHSVSLWFQDLFV